MDTFDYRDILLELNPELVDGGPSSTSERSEPRLLVATCQYNW